MIDKETLKLALEALEANQPVNYCMNNNGEKFPMRHEDPFRFERNTKAITAIKEALAQPEQEPVAWRNAAIRIGEELSSVGPDGYYDMTAEQWLDWAMEQEPRGKNSLAQPEQEPVAYLCENAVGHKYFRWKKPLSTYKPIALYTTPPQRKPLTDEDFRKLADKHLFYQPEGYEVSGVFALARAIEAAHGIKE